jgi:hypothetical protein
MWQAPIWLPAGIAVYAALSIGRCSWPGIFLGAFDRLLQFRPGAGPGGIARAGQCHRSRHGRGIDPASHFEAAAVRPANEAGAFELGAFFDGMLAASVGASIVWAQTSAPLRALPGRWFE